MDLKLGLIEKGGEEVYLVRKWRVGLGIRLSFSFLRRGGFFWNCWRMKGGIGGGVVT